MKILLSITLLMGLVSTAQSAWRDDTGTLVLSSFDGKVYVSSDYVRCGDSEPFPPPTHTYYVTVRPNRSCLINIPNTDGKDLANRAARCDRNNPERNALRGSDCTLLSQQVRHRLAQRVLAKQTSVVYSYQQRTIRNAASVKEYECVR